MQNEIETNLELSYKEQREQFEIRFREAIKQSIPYENSLSVRMLNDMLDTFKNLCYVEVTQHNIKQLRNQKITQFLWKIIRIENKPCKSRKL